MLCSCFGAEAWVCFRPIFGWSNFLFFAWSVAILILTVYTPMQELDDK